MLFCSLTWCIADTSVWFLAMVLFLIITRRLFPTEFQRNSSGIPMESHGFHWESFPEAPGFQPFPSEFLGKKWEFPWKRKPKWLRLQPNAFHRNSMEFRRIPTFHWESGGIRRNSWRRVKTSKEHRNQPRIEGVMADFDEFYEISHNSLSFGPKITFLGSFKSLRVALF